MQRNRIYAKIVICSDTFGKNLYKTVSDYLSKINSSFGFSQDALKGQQRPAQGKRSDTLGYADYHSIDAL